MARRPRHRRRIGGKRGGFGDLTPAENRIKERRVCPRCGTYDPRSHCESFHDDIFYCPLHKSAEEMLEALIYLVKTGPQPDFIYGVIKRAEGRP